MNPSTPPPSPQPQPQPKRPKLVVPSVSRRDVIVGVVIALAVLGFVILAVLATGGYKEQNRISGVVRSRNAPGLRETQFTMGLEKVPKKPVTEKIADTGYSLKVWVESEKREYEVMVEKEIWEKKKDGDTIEFLRPPREQR